ncbi:ribonuclease H-like domain-containing protein [Tanacetum coccineum]
MSHPHPKRKLVPTAVLTRSGKVPINNARQNSSRAAVTVNTARPLNTAYPKQTVNGVNTARLKPAVNTARPKAAVNTARPKAGVNAGRPKAVLKAVKGNLVNAVKASACWGMPKARFAREMYFYSGCQRHMTGNKSLINFEEIDGGFVAFGDNSRGRKITRKGKIRTGNLDFDDVYFVKELKFNLLIVSQMCGKKNNVLFTDTECFVLSSDFKLTDENHVLLKVPRKDNMYSVDLKNIIPKRGLTCLYAKATSDESDLWHRRLRHVNFKTMNKLVKGNLVRVANRPFGCPVTILNTKDNLGKFDGKADEGFFVGYSTNSKAFRVFNSRTRIVEENLHVKFNENTPNITGSRPNWLFDIDALTKTMNYQPVVAGNQTNGNAGTKENIDAGKASVETVPGKDYILLPLWTQDPPFSSSSKNSPDAGFKPSGEEEKQDAKEVPGTEEPRVNQQKDASVNSTNTINTVSPTVNAAGIEVNAVDENIVSGCADDPSMPELEDIVHSDDDEDVGAEADMTNLDIHIPISPIPTTRIHKDHPIEQIIGDIHSAP